MPRADTQVREPSRTPWEEEGVLAAVAEGAGICFSLNVFLPLHQDNRSVEIVEGGALRRRLLESYSRDPRGWSFVLSPSVKSGFYDAVASGPNGAWILKMDTIYKPTPLVLGSEVEPDSSKPEGAFTYGYRKLPPELMLGLFRGGEGTSEEAIRAGLSTVLRTEPVVPDRGGSYAQGPFVLTGPGELRLSEKQRAVDARLTLEMRRLLSRRYPAYG